MSQLLHLAAAVDLPGCSAAEPYVELVRLAERGRLDFVTLEDSFARPGPDALAVLCRAAPATRRIGLVPTVTTTPTEPLVAQAAVATLDRVSGGRAGWRLDVSAGAEEPHHIDFTGTAFSVRDPSTVPRPPQGHPVRLVDATERHARTVAARYADVALVRAATPAQATAVRDELRARAAEFGRDPDALRVLTGLLVDLGDGEHAAEPGHGGGGPRATGRGPLYRGGPVDLAELVAGWHADGVTDGFHFVPVEPRRDLERLVNGTVALLQHRGRFRTFYPGSTLREHLGLTRPANRYAMNMRYVDEGNDGMTTDAADAWKQWHEERVEKVSAPYGPLALTATHWIEDYPEGRIPDIPGTWVVAEREGVLLTAVEADGLSVDGRPFAGEVRLAADRGPEAEARVALGEKRLFVLVREGVWGVRVYDPEAAARRAFRGIEASPYDPRWSVPGRFTPYDGTRTVRVGNADGRERGLALAGELAFALDGRELTLQVAQQGDGPLWAVFADATSGDTSFRFRFLHPAAPDAEGRTTVDLNRAQLPPCAFADHFICPFPPPGNTLDVAIEAGERAVR